MPEQENKPEQKNNSHVVLRPLSANPYYRNECLYCGETATLEVCSDVKNIHIHLRCCNKEKCRQSAKKEAIALAKRIKEAAIQIS